MKTVYVNSTQVQINNYNESDELTPTVVRAALRIAYGYTKVSAIVHDSSKAYRTSPSSIRKVSLEY